MRTQVRGQLAGDHAALDQLLSQFYSAVTDGNSKGSYSTLDLFWARLAVHIRAEHLQLFPRVLKATEGKTARPSFAEVEVLISKLRHDHDFFMRELARAVAELREIGRADEQSVTIARLKTVRKKLQRIQRRLIQHNKTEEEHIYGWANSLLSVREQDKLTTAIRSQLMKRPSRFTANAWEAGIAHHGSPRR